METNLRGHNPKIKIISYLVLGLHKRIVSVRFPQEILIEYVGEENFKEIFLALLKI